MSTAKIRIDYSSDTDSELDAHSSAIVKGCTGNTNFVFTGAALANVTLAQSDYHGKSALIATGNTGSVAAKDAAREVLLDDLRIICTQANLQANGDLVKLKSTGAPLNKEPSSSIMPVPTDMEVKYNDVSGSVHISVDKPNVSDHGTMFAYTLAADAPADINDWKIRHSNGHSLTLKGMTSKQDYKFAAAYKGLDDDELIWCAVITKLVV